jgi:hypothetical protein
MGREWVENGSNPRIPIDREPARSGLGVEPISKRTLLGAARSALMVGSAGMRRVEESVTERAALGAKEAPRPAASAAGGRGSAEGGRLGRYQILFEMGCRVGAWVRAGWGER